MFFAGSEGLPGVELAACNLFYVLSFWNEILNRNKLAFGIEFARFTVSTLFFEMSVTFLSQSCLLNLAIWPEIQDE